MGIFWGLPAVYDADALIAMGDEELKAAGKVAYEGFSRICDTHSLGMLSLAEAMKPGDICEFVPEEKVPDALKKLKAFYEGCREAAVSKSLYGTGSTHFDDRIREVDKALAGYGASVSILGLPDV